MTLVEINFDGIVGPSHNYAGLSLGNIASMGNAGAVSRPRAAALQGLAKMRGNLELGLAQGILPPHRRPRHDWLEALGTTAADAPPPLLAAAMSASPMWTANAATVSPAPDTADGRCHLSVANLLTMPHRALEAAETERQLRLAFAHPAFAVHAPVPAPFGDEGAANHMRLAAGHGAAGVEVFVYGRPKAAFPARQHLEASRAVARRHNVHALFVEQSPAAVAAGAFHNDVVAVANETVLFAHEDAFAERTQFYDELRSALPAVTIVEVPGTVLSLADAIETYLFNGQLVTLPAGGMALVMPDECRDHPRLWSWLEQLVRGNGVIRQLVPVNVRESMANGGGPACLRLRVVADPATVDPRFLVDADKITRLEQVVARYWPEQIDPSQLRDQSLHQRIAHAHAALLDELELPELI